MELKIDGRCTCMLGGEIKMTPCPIHSQAYITIKELGELKRQLRTLQEKYNALEKEHDSLKELVREYFGALYSSNKVGFDYNVFVETRENLKQAIKEDR